MDQGVIRRKLVGARQEPAGGPGGAARGAERVWPLALARAAQDRIGLVPDCDAVRLQHLSLSELLDLPPDRGLIALLDGPKEAQGVLFLGPEVLAAVIEAQTLGRVLATPVVPRKPTRTDAALVADLIDTLLEGLEDALCDHEDLIWTDGFRYASYLEEPRPLALMLEDIAWKVLRCECDFGAGRRGVLVLALPADGQGRRPQPAPALIAPDPLAEDPFTAAFAQQVMEVEAGLTAILGRLRLPLSAALSLAVGDVLPLGMAQLEGVELTGADGQPVAVGKLGQSRGFRAIRLGEGQAAPRAAPPAEVPEAAPPLRLAATG